jgi:hypothetical protein
MNMPFFCGAGWNPAGRLTIGPRAGFQPARSLTSCPTIGPFPAVEGLVFLFRGAWMIGGADSLVGASATDALLSKNQVMAALGKPAWGPAADLGVRPTNSAGFAGPRRLSGIGDECLRHITEPCHP